MTIGLFGAIVYFSMLLSNPSKSSVTQIKKTKASAQTYHKLLALNTLDTLVPTDIPQDNMTESSSSTSSIALADITPTRILLAYTSISPTIIPTRFISPTVQPTIKPTQSLIKIPTSTIIPTYAAVIPTKTVEIPTSIPTPTLSLLVYRTISISPTINATRSISPSQAIISPTNSLIQTTGTVNKTLPETGWVQLSTILFIVAATTVFISFLF